MWRSNEVKEEERMSNEPNATGEVKRAFTYLRVNHAATRNPDAEAAAIERQREQCLAAAQTHGLAVFGEYRDTTGAVSPWRQRPALRRLLEDVALQRIGFVVVCDLARVSRKVRELIEIEDTLAQAGVRLVVYGEGVVDTGTHRRTRDILTASSPGERAKAARRGKAEGRA
jgi:DNA invertase Pin-like site-specific DNA recombinase